MKTADEIAEGLEVLAQAAHEAGFTIIAAVDLKGTNHLVYVGNANTAIGLARRLEFRVHNAMDVIA